MYLAEEVEVITLANEATFFLAISTYFTLSEYKLRTFVEEVEHLHLQIWSISYYCDLYGLLQAELCLLEKVEVCAVEIRSIFRVIFIH